MRPRPAHTRLLLTVALTAIALAGTSALQAAADDRPPPAPRPARPWLDGADISHQRDVQDAVLASVTAANAERARQQLVLAAATRPSRSAASSSSRARAGGGWHDLIDLYSWDQARAYRVMLCESHGNPNARNSSGHNGLFQIAGGPMDPAANVDAAFRMYQQRGWQPWAASRGCWG